MNIDQVIKTLEIAEKDGDALFTESAHFNGWARVEYDVDDGEWVIYYGSEALPPHHVECYTDIADAAKAMIDYADLEEWEWVSEME